MSRNPTGGALIGKSRLLEIDAREFVSSHTDSCTTPANALSAHLQEKRLLSGHLYRNPIRASAQVQIINGMLLQKHRANVSLFPRVEAGYVEAEIMSRVELECAGGTLLAERQQ